MNCCIINNLLVARIYSAHCMGDYLMFFVYLRYNIYIILISRLSKPTPNLNNKVQIIFLRHRKTKVSSICIREISKHTGVKEKESPPAHWRPFYPKATLLGELLPLLSLQYQISKALSLYLEIASASVGTSQSYHLGFFFKTRSLFSNTTKKLSEWSLVLSQSLERKKKQRRIISKAQP